MICITLGKQWSSSCIDLQGWEYILTQALQGFGLGLKEGTAEDSYLAHTTVKPGSALLKPSEDLHPSNQDQNLALTPVKPSELRRIGALPLTAFSPLQPSGNTKSWCRAGGKRSLGQGKQVLPPHPQQREWGETSAPAMGTVSFQQGGGAGFVRRMQWEEPGSSFPPSRQSNKALAGAGIKGFLQEGDVRVRQTLVALLEMSPLTLQMSFSSRDTT